MLVKGEDGWCVVVDLLDFCCSIYVDCLVICCKFVMGSFSC